MIGCINRLLYEEFVNELGSDSTALLGIHLWLHLTKANFTPGLDTDFTAVEKADFDSYSAQSIAAAVRGTGYNPLTGNYEMLVNPPAGGLNYSVGSALNLPQTIYGLVLSDDSIAIDGGHALAYGVLDQTIELSIAGQTFDIPPQRIQVVAPPVNQI